MRGDHCGLPVRISLPAMHPDDCRDPRFLKALRARVRAATPPPSWSRLRLAARIAVLVVAAGFGLTLCSVAGFAAVRAPALLARRCLFCWLRAFQFCRRRRSRLMKDACEKC